MFAYVNGFLEDATVDNAVIDVNGFGINVRISADTASRLPGIGEQVRLYTYTYVKEDAFLLYGFLSRSDLEMFKLCITVSGIGPKGALAILSVMDADALRFAIMSGDAKAISRAPGVGARTAQRLILGIAGLDIKICRLPAPYGWALPVAIAAMMLCSRRIRFGRGRKRALAATLCVLLIG